MGNSNNQQFRFRTSQPNGKHWHTVGRGVVVLLIAATVFHLCSPAAKAQIDFSSMSRSNFGSSSQFNVNHSSSSSTSNSYSSPRSSYSSSTPRRSATVRSISKRSRNALSRIKDLGAKTGNSIESGFHKGISRTNHKRSKWQNSLRKFVQRQRQKRLTKEIRKRHLADGESRQSVGRGNHAGRESFKTAERTAAFEDELANAHHQEFGKRFSRNKAQHADVEVPMKAPRGVATNFKRAWGNAFKKIKQTTRRTFGNEIIEPPVEFSVGMAQDQLDKHNTNHQGIEHFKRGNYRAALKTFDQALSDNPNDLQILHNKSLAEKALNGHQTAVPDKITKIKVPIPYNSDMLKKDRLESSLEQVGETKQKTVQRLTAERDRALKELQEAKQQLKRYSSKQTASEWLSLPERRKTQLEHGEHVIKSFGSNSDFLKRSASEAAHGRGNSADLENRFETLGKDLKQKTEERAKRVMGSGRE